MIRGRFTLIIKNFFERDLGWCGGALIEGGGEGILSVC